MSYFWVWLLWLKLLWILIHLYGHMFTFLMIKYLDVESSPALLSLSPHFCFLESPPNQLSEPKPSPQILILETSKLKCHTPTIWCFPYLTDEGKLSIKLPYFVLYVRNQLPITKRPPLPPILSLQDFIQLVLTYGSPQSDYKCSVDRNFHPYYVIFTHSE